MEKAVVLMEATHMDVNAKKRVQIITVTERMTVPMAHVVTLCVS